MGVQDNSGNTGRAEVWKERRGELGAICVSRDKLGSELVMRVQHTGAGQPELWVGQGAV